MRIIKAPGAFPGADKINASRINADNEQDVLELTKEIIGKGHETAIASYLQTHEKRLKMLENNGFSIEGGEITVLTARRPEVPAIPQASPQAIFDKFTDGGKSITQEGVLKAIAFAQDCSQVNLTNVNREKSMKAFLDVVNKGCPSGVGSSYLYGMATMTCFIAGRAYQQAIENAPAPVDGIEGIKARPAVTWFAGQMEKKLQENDHKGGWGDMTFDELYLRIKKEMQELLGAEMMKKSPEDIIRECSDVANFCMMIADIHANKYGK
jgi:hypothetical protein